MRWEGHEAFMERTLVGKPEGKRPLGSPKRRWEHNTKMSLKVIRWGGMDWSRLLQERNQWRALMNKVMNIRAT
jgi:hypothetical protein